MARDTTLRLPRIVAYGYGHFGISLLVEAVLILLVHFYSAKDKAGVALLSVGAATLAVGIGQACDAVAAPIVGMLSDRTRNRFGRRVPFIALTAVPVCVAFALLWSPPTRSESTANMVHLIALCSVFYITYCALTVPYLSWLSDIARTNRDRALASSVMAFFNVLGAALCGGAGWVASKLGYAAMGWVCAVVAFTSFATVLAARLHRYEYSATDEPKIGFVDSFRHTWRNPHFRVYVASFAVFSVGLRILLYDLPWLAGTILRIGRTDAEIAVGPMQACCIGVAVATFPLMTRLTKRFGKVALYRAGLVAFVILGPQFLWVGHLPGISPRAQLYALMGLAGIPTGLMFVIPYTILADIIDYDEARVGQRRDAMYFGAQGLPIKLGWLGGLAVAGSLCDFFDAASGEDLGPRLACLAAAGFVLIALLLFRKFDLRPIAPSE